MGSDNIGGSGSVRLVTYVIDDADGSEKQSFWGQEDGA